VTRYEGSRLGFGKFQSVETLVLYGAMLDGSGDEFVGNADIGESAELFRGPITNTYYAEKLAEADAFNWEHATYGEAIRAQHALTRMVGAILYVDSQGFVDSEEFNDEHELAEAWAKATDAYADDEDGEGSRMDAYLDACLRFSEHEAECDICRELPNVFLGSFRYCHVGRMLRDEMVRTELLRNLAKQANMEFGRREDG
jgi:hypothetical protein